MRIYQALEGMSAPSNAANNMERKTKRENERKKENEEELKGKRRICRRREARYRAKVKILFHKNLDLLHRTDRKHLASLGSRYQIGQRRREAELRQGRSR